MFVLSLFVTANIAIAEESTDDGVDDGDYVELEKDEKAPYAGYLFDHGSIAALIARNEKEKDQIVLDKDTEYKKLKLNLDAEILKKQTEIDINKKLAEDILKLNKEELQLTKSKLERVSWLSPSMFVTGIVAGTIITVSILKIAVQTIK